MRLDHRRSDVAHTRPHPAGCPVTGLAVAVSIRVRPVRAAEGCALPAAYMPPRFSLRTPHGRRHPCRRPSVPYGNSLRCKRTPLAFDCARDASIGAGRAIVGKSSFRGRRPRERWCLHVTRAGMDAGGFAKPAGRRPAMTKPDPRRNFHWRAGRTAGGSERRRTNEGRAVRGGDATTTTQAAYPTPEQQCPSRMDAATAPQPTDHPMRVRACPANSKPRPRNPRQVKLPRQRQEWGQIHFGPNGTLCRRGGARTRWHCSGGCADWRRIHAAGVSLVSGWVRGLRSCCSAAASMRLDHRRSDVAQTRPLPAGFPVTGPAVAVPIYVRPIRAAEGRALPAASMPPRFLLRTTTRSAASCRRPSVPDGNGLRCKMRRWRSIAPERLPRRRPRNRRQVKLPRQEAAGALVFARDASRHGCRRTCTARGPEARHDQAHPTPELPWASRQEAGGSERCRNDEGRAARGGDATTTPQAAHQLKELHKTSRMDVRLPTEGGHRFAVKHSSRTRPG